MTAVPNPHALNSAIQIFQSAYGSMKSQWLLVMCKTAHSFSFEISLQAREGPASVGLSDFFFSVSLQRTLRLFMNEESRLSHRNLHFQHASMKTTFTFHNSQYSKIKLSKYYIHFKSYESECMIAKIDGRVDCGYSSFVVQNM